MFWKIFGFLLPPLFYGVIFIGLITLVQWSMVINPVVNSIDSYLTEFFAGSGSH